MKINYSTHLSCANFLYVILIANEALHGITRQISVLDFRDLHTPKCAPIQSTVWPRNGYSKRKVRKTRTREHFGKKVHSEKNECFGSLVPPSYSLSLSFNFFSICSLNNMFKLNWLINYYGVASVFC